MTKQPLLLLFTILFITTSLVAQPGKVTLEDGTTKTTTTETLKDGTLVTTDEFRTPAPNSVLRGFRITKTDLLGNTQVTDSITTPGGKPLRVTMVRKNADKEPQYAEERNYDDRGNSVLQYRIRVYDGYIIKVTNFKTGKEKMTEETTREGDPGPLAPLHPERDKDLPVSQVKPSKLDVSAGYSFLGTLGMDENMTFPVGFYVGADYYLNHHWGVRAEFSLHTKKDDPEKINRTKLALGVTYRFWNMGGLNKITPQVNALLGMGSETFKVGDFKETEKGIIAALGGGADVRLSPSATLRLKADLLLNRLNDETLKDYRLMGGIVIHLSELFDE